MSLPSLSLTLMAWLHTFPHMDGRGEGLHDINTLLDDVEAVTAILGVANEICDEKASSRKDVDTIWQTISRLLHKKMPGILSKPQTANELRIMFITSLLCYAVSDKCTQQRIYVERIIKMPSQFQKMLFRIIEHEITPGTNVDVSSTQIGYGGCDQGFESPDRTILNTPGEYFFSPESCPSYDYDADVDKLIEDLREQNECLKFELDNAQRRENDLARKVDQNEDKFRKEMIKLESISMWRMEDTRNDHQQELSRLQAELHEMRDLYAELEQSQKAFMDERVDERQHAEAALKVTEEKLRVCTERLGELGDMKRALIREEEAHSATGEECHRLRSELKASNLQLKLELEEYMERSRNAETQLFAIENDLVALHKISQELERERDAATEELVEYKEEVERLRYRLAAATKDSGESHVLSEQLTTCILRRENMQLRAYLAEVEHLSQGELNSSQEHIADLQAQIDAMKTTETSLRCELDDTKSYLIESRLSQLEVSKCNQEFEAKMAELQIDAEEWKRRADDAVSFSSKRQMLLKTIEENHATALASIEEEDLKIQKEITVWMKIATDAGKALGNVMNELIESRDDLGEVRLSLDAALARELVLKEHAEDLENAMSVIKAEHDEKEKKLASLVNRDTRETYPNLDELTKSELIELLKSEDKSLELLQKERLAHQAQMKSMAQDHMLSLHKLRTEREEIESRLQDQHTQELAFAVKTAHQERERLAQEHQATLDQTSRNDWGEMEKEISNLRETFAIMRQEYEAGMKRSDAMVSSCKRASETASKQVQSLSEVNKNLKHELEAHKGELRDALENANDLSVTNDKLAETLEEQNLQIQQLQEDNDQLRGQLDKRFSDNSKVKDQLETLCIEYNTLFEENKALKREFSQVLNMQKCFVSVISGSTEVFTQSYSTGVAFYGTTPKKLRKEFALKAQSLVEEKRALVARNNASLCDQRKAEKRLWEADQQIAELKKELRGTKLGLHAMRLALQRSMCHDSVVASEGEQSETKENVPVEAMGLEVVVMGAKTIVNPGMINGVPTPLTPSSMVMLAQTNVLSLSMEPLSPLDVVLGERN